MIKTPCSNRDHPLGAVVLVLHCLSQRLRNLSHSQQMHTHIHTHTHTHTHRNCITILANGVTRLSGLALTCSGRNTSNTPSDPRIRNLSASTMRCCCTCVTMAASEMHERAGGLAGHHALTSGVQITPRWRTRGSPMLRVTCDTVGATGDGDGCAGEVIKNDSQCSCLDATPHAELAVQRSRYLHVQRAHKC